MTSPFSIGGEVEVASTCPYAFLHPDVRKVLCHAPVEEALLKPPCSLLLEYGKCYKLADLKSEELKIGDWVLCLNSGETARIIQINNSSPYSIQLDDKSWSRPCNMCKLSPDEIKEHLKPELKIGDWVEQCKFSPNQIFQIESVRFSDWSKKTTCKDSAGHEYYAEDLRKLTPEEIAMHTGTIGYKMQECNDEMENAMETLRELLAPLVDERLSGIEKRLAILEGERPEVCDESRVGSALRKAPLDCHTNTEPINIAIWIGEEAYTNESTCPSDLVIWSKKVLDGMREGDRFELD